MGFQPKGDLPDGIIIPPVTVDNCTDSTGAPCDYDYADYDGESAQEERTRGVVNRARNNNNQQSPASQRVNNHQNRGQQISQPITPAPLPRQQTPAPQSQRARPAFQQQGFQQQTFQSAQQPAPQSAFQPAPQSAFQPAPQAAFRPAPTPAPKQEAFLPTPPPPKNPGSSLSNPSRGRQGGRGRQGNPRPDAARPAAARPSPPVATDPRPSAPRSSGSGGFSNFPARTGAPSRQEAPQAFRQAPQASPQASRQAPQRQLQQRQEPALPPPSFNNFRPSGQQTSVFAARQPAPPARPALTFQDSSSATLPPSALEVVDFNQLLGVFQGQASGSRGQQTSSRGQQTSSRGQQTSSRGQGRAFLAQAAVPAERSQLPGVFQSANFPVRVY